MTPYFLHRKLSRKKSRDLVQQNDHQIGLQVFLCISKDLSINFSSQTIYIFSLFLSYRNTKTLNSLKISSLEHCVPTLQKFLYLWRRMWLLLDQPLTTRLKDIAVSKGKFISLRILRATFGLNGCAHYRCHALGC